MEQFTQFSVEKRAVVDRLNHLRCVLETLGNMGFDVAADLQKIASALQSIEADVLRIALLGAFSDGKTSVVAAWLGKLMADMKIDMDESSDRLAIYHPEGLPDRCEIVDTPGLFGDKELTVGDKQVMYEDLTKRYISEAHLILYVVDATNPLKESHGVIVKWILRDLNKLSSTVFVINKMDEVTDLTEPELFEEQAAIKRENLKTKLQRAAGLTPDELSCLNIVCVAANPNDRGLKFWFEKPEQYEGRSRINHLKALTGKILQGNVPAVLVAKTGLDVVRDVVGQRVAIASAELERLEAFAQQNMTDTERLQQDIRQGRKEVKALARELYNELLGMEKSLMNGLRPLSLKDIRGFLEDEIGYSQEGVGYKLHLKIKMTVDHYFELSSSVVRRLSDEITQQMDSSASFLSTIGGSAAKSVGRIAQGLSKMDPATIKAAILTARNTLAETTGYVFKFKPWGATNLAGGIAKWAGPLGGAFVLGADIYGAYKAHELEQELQKCKDQIGALIKDAFKDIYDILGDDDRLFESFAPQIKQFESVVTEMREKSEVIRSNRERLASIKGQLGQLTLPAGNRSSEGL